MYRFLLRPKWILFHLVVLAASVGMLGLAKWQWDRHLERDAFVSKVEAREAAEPTDLVGLLQTSTPADIEYHRVTMTGSFVGTTQLIEINQVAGAVNGSNVLAPFQVTDGPIVLVNRGFLADAVRGPNLPPPPTGTLLVGGMARTTEVRQTGELTDDNAGAGNEVRRVDLPAIENHLGLTLAPVYLDFIASEPPTAAPPAPVAKPDLSDGPPHVSYTVQWCIFSMAVLVGWVLAVRRSLSTRRRAATAATAASRDEPAPEALSAAGPTQPSV
jgi:cytochrome oxidase assembly protein ShyY1